MISYKYFLTLLSSFFIATLLLSSCSSSIKHSQHKTKNHFDLTTLSNYQWLSSDVLDTISPQGGHNAELNQLIHQSIDSVLDNKGYVISKNNIEFTLDYRISFHEKVVASDVAYSDSENNNNKNDYGLKWKIGDGEASYQGLNQPDEEKIFLQVGELHVGAFVKDELVWHASFEKIINDKHSQAKRTISLQKAITSLAKKFPTQ